jgi:hypothetical protein
MQPLDKAFMAPLKTFYCQETEKLLRSHPGRVVTVYQIGQLFGNAYKRAATGEIAANGFQEPGIFPCNKSIFKPHDFCLASENTDAVPVNRPGLLKTGDEPSLNSANRSPSTSAGPLRASDISPVSSLNLKRNLRGGTAKKITSSPYKGIVEETQKKKIQQATKSKTKRFVSNALLGPSKRLKRRVRCDPTPSETTPDWDTQLVVAVADDSTEVHDEQDADSLYCTGRFSEDHNGEDRIRCQKCLSWAHTLCAGTEEDFVCDLVRDKHCVVLSLCRFHF